MRHEEETVSVVAEAVEAGPPPLPPSHLPPPLPPPLPPHAVAVRAEAPFEPPVPLAATTVGTTDVPVSPPRAVVVATTERGVEDGVDQTMLLPAVKAELLVESPPANATGTARPPVQVTRPEPRPRTGAHARVAASSASSALTGAGAGGPRTAASRPSTRPSAPRPGSLTGRGERPGALEWKPATPFVAGSYVLEVEAELGAYGVTFAGRDRQSGEPVQVLVLHPAFFSAMRRQNNLESLERATRYDHPEVASVLAVGELGPTRWVATRPVGGMPLTHWRRDLGAMPLVETLRVVERLMGAVENIHAAGGVHGGLSPETIRFYPASDAETGARADRLLLVHPFWLDACDVPPAELRPPRTAWLAPELVFGEAAGPAADVYGVGLVLGYLLACGMTEPGHSLLVQGIDVPPSLDDVYVVATSRHPEHRFESIAALRDALAVACGADWDEALERSRHEGHSRAPLKPLRAEILEVDGPEELAEAEVLAEVTDEDYAPVFAVAQAVPVDPSLGDTDTDERTDTALPAFEVLDDRPADDLADDPEGVAVTQISWAAQAAVNAPTTGRSKRVVVPTLPHGQRSGLLPVAEASPPAPPALQVPARIVEAPVPTIANEVAGAPDTLVRVKGPKSAASERPLPAHAGSAPPPLPPQAVTVEPTEILDYSSSLEALDLGPGVFAQATVLPPLPPPSHELGAGAPFGADPEVEAESTLVEPVAPALLEKYEDEAARAVESMLGPEPTLVSATLVKRAPKELDALPGAALSSLGPPPPPLEVAPASSPISGLIAAPNTPRAEHLPSGMLASTPANAAVVPNSSPEPRTLRDPSGALAGATVVHSGAHALTSGARDLAIGPASRELSRPTLGAVPRAAGPTLGDMHAGPLSAHIARPVERNQGWILWAVVALVVGGVIAFFAFGSSESKPEAQSVAVNPAPDATGADAAGGDAAVARVDTTVDTGSAGEAEVALAAVGDAGPDDTAGDAMLAQAEVSGDAVGGAADGSAVGLADAATGDALALAPQADAVAPVADAAVAVSDVVAPADAAVAAVPDKADTAVAPDTNTPANPTEMPEIVSDPDKLKCPDGMLRLKRKIKVDAPDGQKLDSWEVACIDRFEYPGAGASPSVGLDISGARAACASRGKRLCTRSEWRRACGGTYPYGKDYDPERCNTAGVDGTPKPIVAAGSKKGCMSPSGAFDMVGNVAEWTSDGFINGGTSMRNSDDATCGSASRRAGGAPHVGFRCCADAK